MAATAPRSNGNPFAEPAAAPSGNPFADSPPPRRQQPQQMQQADPGNHQAVSPATRTSIVPYSQQQSAYSSLLGTFLDPRLGVRRLMNPYTPGVSALSEVAPPRYETAADARVHTFPAARRNDDPLNWISSDAFGQALEDAAAGSRTLAELRRVSPAH